jgi:hypothetical protein
MITRSVYSIGSAPFKAAPLAAAIAALTLSLPQPALADVPEPQCEQLVCTVPLTEELSFEVSADSFVHYDNRLELSGQVIVHTPVQSVTLNEADLVLEAKPGAKPVPYRFYGTARPQMKELPIFGDATPYNYVPVAVIGLVDRATLKGLLEDEDTKLPLSEIPKDPHGDPQVLTDPAYLFFHFQSGLSAEVPLAEWLGLHHLGVDRDALDFKIPGEQSATFVLDPAEPYLLLAQDNDMELVDKLSPAHQAAAASAQVVNARAAPMSGGGIQDDPDTPIPDLGQLAFSAQGGIPFEPRNTWGLPEEVGHFKGHLLVETELPLLDILEVNGTILNRFGEQDGLIGAQFGANGDFGIDFELIPGLDFEFPVLDGTLGMFVTQDDAEIYFSGTQTRDYSFLPDFVPLTPFEDTRVAGYISRYKLDESRLMADGRFGLNMANFSRMIDVPLQDIEIARARLTLDKEGVRLEGRTSGSIHPDIGVQTEAKITVWVSFSDPQDSYLTMSGEMSLLGAGFKPVGLRVDRKGLSVGGAFKTPISTVLMGGAIDANGPRLSGATMVSFSRSQILAPLASTEAVYRAAMKEHSRLLAVVNHYRAIVEAERAPLFDALQDAKDLLAEAEREIESFRKSIAKHRADIRYWKRQIANKSAWYDNLGFFDKIKEGPATGIYIANRAEKITKAGLKIGKLEAAKWAAEKGLPLARKAVELAEDALPSIPVDADPRVAAHLGAEWTARMAMLNARKAYDALYAELPDWAKRGGFSGMMHLQLDRSGMSGKIRTMPHGVEVSARVELDGNPEVCVDFPKVGEACKAL